LHLLITITFIRPLAKVLVHQLPLMEPQGLAMTYARVLLAISFSRVLCKKDIVINTNLRISKPI